MINRPTTHNKIIANNLYQINISHLRLQVTYIFQSLFLCQILHRLKSSAKKCHFVTLSNNLQNYKNILPQLSLTAAVNL